MERGRDRSCNERMTKPTVAAIKMSRSHSYGQMVYCSRWLEFTARLPACLTCLPLRRKQKKAVSPGQPRHAVALLKKCGLIFGADFFLGLSACRSIPSAVVVVVGRDGWIPR